MRVAVEVLNQPVVYVVRDVDLGLYLFNSVECLTVSMALLKSRARTITNWLVVRRLVIVCGMVIRAAVVEPEWTKGKLISK